jgi:aminoglycoside 3-N-acetyltransferase
MDLFTVKGEPHDDAALAEVLGRFGFRGVSIMVASSLLGFGRPSGPAILPRLLELLVGAVGPEGTVIIPAYTFSAYKNEVFDPATSKGLGSLADAAQRGGRFARTVHPVYSHLVCGRHAGHLAASPPTTCFGPNSFFARFAALDDARLVLLGGNLNMLTIWHLYDQLHSVPWRFVKTFRGRIKTEAGVEEIGFDSCVKRHEAYAGRAYCFDKLDVVARMVGSLDRHPYAASFVSSIAQRDLERLYRAAVATDPDYFLFGGKEELDAYYFRNELDAARANLDGARVKRIVGAIQDVC